MDNQSPQTGYLGGELMYRRDFFRIELQISKDVEKGISNVFPTSTVFLSRMGPLISRLGDPHMSVLLEDRPLFGLKALFKNHWRSWSNKPCSRYHGRAVSPTPKPRHSGYLDTRAVAQYPILHMAALTFGNEDRQFSRTQSFRNSRRKLFAQMAPRLLIGQHHRNRWCD